MGICTDMPIPLSTAMMPAGEWADLGVQQRVQSVDGYKGDSRSLSNFAGAIKSDYTYTYFIIYIYMCVCVYVCMCVCAFYIHLWLFVYVCLVPLLFPLFAWELGPPACVVGLGIAQACHIAVSYRTWKCHALQHQPTWHRSHWCDDVGPQDLHQVRNQRHDGYSLSSKHLWS